MPMFSQQNHLHDMLKKSVLNSFQSSLPNNKNVHIQGLLGVTLEESEVVLVQIDHHYLTNNLMENCFEERSSKDCVGEIKFMPSTSSSVSQQQIKKKRRKRKRKLSEDNENKWPDAEDNILSDCDSKLELYTTFKPEVDGKSNTGFNECSPKELSNDAPIPLLETLDFQTPIPSTSQQDLSTLSFPTPSSYDNPYLSNIIKSIQSSPCDPAAALNVAGKSIGTGYEIQSSDICKDGANPNPKEASRQAARMMLVMGQLPDTSHLEKVKEKKEKTERNYLSLAEKMKVIEARKLGKSHRELAKMFNVGKTQVTSILKRQDFYEEAIKFTCNKSRKRTVAIRTANEDINAMTYKWYMEETANERTVTGPRIQEKALQFAELLGITNFKASNGWLDSFKKRHGIVSSKKDKNNPAHVEPDNFDSSMLKTEDSFNFSSESLGLSTDGRLYGFDDSLERQEESEGTCDSTDHNALTTAQIKEEPGTEGYEEGI